MRKPLSLLSAIGSVPIAALLAVCSAGVTLVVAVSTVSTGQVPGNAGLELIGALVLAAVAASEASRPQRHDRDRRERGARGQDGQGAATGRDQFGIGAGFDGD